MSRESDRLRAAADVLDLGLLPGSIYSRDRDEALAALMQSAADERDWNDSTHEADSYPDTWNGLVRVSETILREQP